MKCRDVKLLLLVVAVFLLPARGDARQVHGFDCTLCHQSLSSAEISYMTYNLCLACHFPGNSATYALSSIYGDGASNPIAGTFASGDASNALGSYPEGTPPGAQTSHYWAGAADIAPAAGAGTPPDFLYNFGWSNGKITCSRCHDPHAEQNNPKLLRMGAGTTNAMCLDCHGDWNVTGNHGLGSHPMHANYAALAAAEPERFRAAPDNFGTNGGIALVGGEVSCTSCHGVHYADSDSATVDGPGGELSDGDGKLLKFDGPGRENPDQSLCQSCHTYNQHGGDSGLGCMVCHGGHEYDSEGSPNYYMLKKQVVLTSVPKTGAPGTVALDYTSYPVPANLGGICEQCHLLSARHDSNDSCKDCHFHKDGFAHGAGSSGVGCVECHGHDAGYEYNAGNYSQGAGSFQSHSTHTENDADDLKGPNIGCGSCHDTNNYPYFKSGADANGDGLFSLAETDVCDVCHSPGGPFDGVGDVAIGARNNWRSGVYSGSSLAAGKEQWCVGCHDSGTSLIGGRQAPNVAGNNTSYGYFLSGHGAFSIGCDGCHGTGMAHIDGQKTYVASSSQNYKVGYRLSDVDGNDPLIVPATQDACNYHPEKYRLCFSCHSEESLLQDTRSSSFYCTTNPYLNAASMPTGFSNQNAAGGTTRNLHWDHLMDYNKDIGGAYWDSDNNGTDDSEAVCITCHNPHSEAWPDNRPTLAMTKSGLGITTGSDGNGSYGQGPMSVPCAWCHGSPTKYYRTPPTPPALTPPETPLNTTPAPGATGLTQPQTLVASAFSDPDSGDTHKLSQWLISSAAGEDFSNNLIYDSGVITGTTSHAPSLSWTSGATYYWKVRYRDNHGIWSEYSEDTGFTILTNELPAQPVHLLPLDDARNVPRQPTLVASPFSDADPADTHVKVVWQLSTNDGDDFAAGLVHASGQIVPTVNGSNQPYYNVPVLLNLNQRYYWRTRYQDSKGQWSDISEITSFVTTCLISRFEFEEGSGTVVYDSQGTNHASLGNGTTRTTGFNGQGVTFTGTNNTGNDVIWTYAGGAPANNFTLEAMVKATTTHQIDAESTATTTGTSGQRYLFESTFAVGTNSTAGVSLGTNGISVYEHSAGYMPPLAVYSDPTVGTDWNHVVVTYTKKGPRIYLNGQLVHVGETSPKDNVYASARLGNGVYGPFNGMVDDVSIYNKPLSAVEVFERCVEVGKCSIAGDRDGDSVPDASDNCVFEHNPTQDDQDGDGVGDVCDYLGYWKLDEGKGLVAADEAGEYHADVANDWEFWTDGISGRNGGSFPSYNNVKVNGLLDNHAGDFTLSAWFRFPSGTTNPTWSLGKGNVWNDIGFGVAHWVTTDTPVPPGLFLNDGTPSAAHRISLYGSPAARGSWAHYVWTVDRTNNVMKVYKNGNYENEVSIAILGTNAVTDGRSFDFGLANLTNHYNGDLDNVAVYDFVLDADNVRERCVADGGAGNCDPNP